nr:MAG TPA: hypothetical protein [Microviridae sp.]
MKSKQIDMDSLIEFHVVIRPIPETNAYSVVVGVIQDGQFAPTSLRPDCCSFDWAVVKPNPLIPNQNYVSAIDLHDLISEILTYSNDVMFFPNMLVFVIKDYPYQDESTEKEDEE